MRRLASIAVVLTVACGGPPPPRVARLGYIHEMVTLDPHSHNDGITGTILSAVYEPLVRIVPGHGPEPVLAASWSTPSPTVWRFVLRPGVLHHDGRPLTADDVVASFRRVRSGVGLTVATYLDAVAEVRRAEGTADAVEILTHAPAPHLLPRVSMVAIAPQYFDPQRPLGTGPYRWVSGRERGIIVLGRWEHYWDRPPEVEEVQITFPGSDDRLVELMTAGGLDVMTGVSPDFLRTRALPGGWSVVEAPFLGTTMLGLNVSRPPLSDPRVREAVELALDRRELLARAFPERGALPAASLLPAGVVGRPEAGEVAVADRERARALLAEAGAAGSRVRLSGLGLDRAATDELARQLRAVGLEVELVNSSYEQSYRRMMDAQTELFAFGWSFRFGDPADFLESVVHSRQPERRLGLINGGGYSSPLVDRLVEEASRMSDPAAREQRLRQVLEAVARDRAYLPLYHLQRFGLLREPFRIDSRSGLWALPQEIRVTPARRE